MKPKMRTAEIIVQELRSELLIYDLRINKAFSLNETCAVVWRECDGKRTTQEIATILNRETDGLVNEEVVWLALDTLRKENLLEESFEMNLKFNGMNRRNAITKGGLATMAVLPIIASLIAPYPANAQSVDPPIIAQLDPIGPFTGSAGNTISVVVRLFGNLGPTVTPVDRTVFVASSNPLVATAPGSLVIPAGSGQVSTSIILVSNGSAIIQVTSSGLTTSTSGVNVI